MYYNYVLTIKRERVANYAVLRSYEKLDHIKSDRTRSTVGDYTVRKV